MPRRYTAREIHALANDSGVDYVVMAIEPEAIEPGKIADLIKTIQAANRELESLLSEMD